MNWWPPMADGSLALPVGKFAAIVADPPWHFRTWDRRRAVASRQAEDPYPTMTMAQLRALQVGALSTNSAALFLWAPDCMLQHALGLGEAWGYRFKTIAFVWVKADLADVPLRPRMSLGYWTRKQAEQCLLFTRGKPTRLSRAVPHVIIEPTREHSRKPDVVYDRVRDLVGGPHLELFARTRRPGWTAWGNEVDLFGDAA